MSLVARHAGVNLVWDEAAEPAGKQRTVLKVSETPVGEILDALAARAGLQCSLRAEAVVVSVAAP